MVKKSTKLVKRVFKGGLLVILCTLIFSTYAFAFGVTFNSQSIPLSVNRNAKATYKLNLTYDSTVYGIPIPAPSCQMGAEIPHQPFKAPKYVSGSFDTMKFAIKTGSETGETVYESYKSFTVIGQETKQYTVTAIAENFIASGKGYVGVGGGTHVGYDFYFTTTTKLA